MRDYKTIEDLKAATDETKQEPTSFTIKIVDTTKNNPRRSKNKWILSIIQARLHRLHKTKRLQKLELLEGSKKI